MTNARPDVASALTADDRARLESRLFNWADWLFQNSSEAGVCASAEGRYRNSPDSEALVAAVRRQTIDSADAEKVDKAVRSMQATQRTYLQLAYVRLRPPKYLQKALHYAADRHDALHALVLLALKAELIKQDRAGILIRRGAPIWAGLAKR